MPKCFLSLTEFFHRYYCSTSILWILKFILFPKEKQGFLKNRHSKLRLIFSSFFLPTCVHFAIKIDQNLLKIDIKFYCFFYGFSCAFLFVKAAFNILTFEVCEIVLGRRAFSHGMFVFSGLF